LAGQQRRTRIAEARLRLIADGRELRVTVDDVLFFSRLFPGDQIGKALGIESAGTPENLLAHGWQHEPEPTEKGRIV
jgi:hypothetical protein